MPNTYLKPSIIHKLAPFKIDGFAIPYAEFAPKLYNLCMTLGFRKGLIMPSRAFCSDENQGWPIILLTKHFGTFPFNHGRVGGVVATDRHGPHAHHGEDSVLVQASHVGYDPHTGAYGKCTRPKMLGTCISDSCGKITHVITPYLEQYQFAQERIFLHRDDKGNHLITVKNSFVDFDSHPVKNGLVLHLENLVPINDSGKILPVAAISTSQTYQVSEEFRRRLDATGYVWKSGEGESIGTNLTEDLFYFREDFHETDESILLERNLIEFMPIIVTSRNPQLRAAKINIQLDLPVPLNPSGVAPNMPIRTFSMWLVSILISRSLRVTRPPPISCLGPPIFSLRTVPRRNTSTPLSRKPFMPFSWSKIASTRNRRI